MSAGQRESTISTLVSSGSKYGWNSWLHLSCPVSWLVISSGEVLVLLLIPLMTSYKCLLTWTSEKQHCSLELLCPSRWFSLWFLPDLLYLDTYLSSIWSRDAFLNLGLESCNTKTLLRTIEVLSFVVFFQRCQLPHESLITSLCSSFVSLPPSVSLPSSIMFSDLPQISFYAFIRLTWIFPFPFSLCGAKWEEVLGTALLHVYILCDVSLKLRNGEGCDALSSEQRSWILRAFGPFHDGPRLLTAAVCVAVQRCVCYDG